MRTATATPPGPVHFEFPQSETTREAGDYVAEPPLMPNWIVPGPDRADLKPALDMLGKSKRPILIAGLGVYWCGGSAEFVKFAERLGAPVLTTTKCKGMIPEDHVLRAGCIIGGLIERKLVMEADLIVTVGLDAVELQPKPWPYTLPVLALSSVPSVDALVPADPEIIGDLKALLAGLAQWAPEGTNWGEKAAKAFRQEVRDALNTPSTGLSPQRTMEVARAVLPRNTIATCDAGASRLLIVQKWESYGPREFLTSNGLASMGYAVPGALAARMAFPDRPVVAFTRDGGFLMTVAELQTAQRENLPMCVVVLDDREIGLIRVKQEIKGIPLHGVQIGGVDWEKLAQSFGADGVVVETEQALSAALSAAVQSKRTTVIGVRIDASGYVAQFNALRELSAGSRFKPIVDAGGPFRRRRRQEADIRLGGQKQAALADQIDLTLHIAVAAAAGELAVLAAGGNQAFLRRHQSRIVEFAGLAHIGEQIVAAEVDHVDAVDRRDGLDIFQALDGLDHAHEKTAVVELRNALRQRHGLDR